MRKLMRRLRWFGVVEGRLLWTGTKGAVVLGRYQEVALKGVDGYQRSTRVISYFRTDE